MQSNHRVAASSLERAIEIAARAHAGQTDKGGAPYVLHPLRVMLQLRDPVAQIAAVLHDVVEDCAGWSLARLRGEGFSDEVVDAVAAVTKQPEDEPPANASEEVRSALYLQFIRRAGGHPIGRLVKQADLEDNLDDARLPQPLSAKDEARLARYRLALAELRGCDERL